MTTGNTEWDEKQRFKNLSDQELKHLYGIYQNRLNQLVTELRKRKSGVGDVCILSIDMMKRYGHSEPAFEKDVEYMVKKFSRDKDWSTTHSKNSSELFALCIVNELYRKYNIEFNPYDYMDDYDIDGTQFNMLYSKIYEWASKNYWK